MKEKMTQQLVDRYIENEAKCRDMMNQIKHLQEEIRKINGDQICIGEMLSKGHSIKELNSMVHDGEWYHYNGVNRYIPDSKIDKAVEIVKELGKTDDAIRASLHGVHLNRIGKIWKWSDIPEKIKVLMKIDRTRRLKYRTKKLKRHALNS